MKNKLTKQELEQLHFLLEKGIENRQIEIGWHEYDESPNQNCISNGATIASRNTEVCSIDDNLIEITLFKPDYLYLAEM